MSESSNENADLRRRLAEAERRLDVINGHVMNALLMLGVDVSVSGYIPDSWTLRERCAAIWKQLAASKAALEAAKALRAEAERKLVMLDVVRGVMLATLRDVKTWCELTRRESSAIYKPVCDAIDAAMKEMS